MKYIKLWFTIFVSKQGYKFYNNVFGFRLYKNIFIMIPISACAYCHKVIKKPFGGENKDHKKYCPDERFYKNLSKIRIAWHSEQYLIDHYYYDKNKESFLSN